MKGRDAPDSWETLVESHWRPLYRAAERILGRAHEAEDACQEALVAAFRAIDRFDRTRPIEPWLFGILDRVCLKKLRSRRRRREVPLEAAPEVPSETVLAADSEEDRARLRDSLDSLPPRDRFLVVARHYQGLSNQEIARALGLTPNAVGVALFRAMERLRRKAASPRQRDNR